MKLYQTALPIVLALSLSACQPGQGNKQTGGTLVGAGLGALVGSQIGSGGGQLAAVAIGTLAGAFLGSEVGKSLDRADQLAMERTSQSALETAPTGQVSNWRNPDSGNSGTVVPTRTYQTRAGRNCREYTQTVTIEGRTETIRGTACRQYDGTWKVADN
jgi:surface antigen